MAEKSGGNMAEPGAAADGAEAGRTRRIGGRTVAIAAAVVVALFAAGGVAWKVHADDLLTRARSDCAAAGERLRAATNDYNALLNGQAATMAKTDVRSVRDAKTLDALSKAMEAATPTVVSCRADSRTGVQETTRRVTANAAWYKAHRKSLSRLVEAVETSRLDKTVDDAKAAKEKADAEAKARAEQEAAAAAAAAQQQQAQASQSYSSGSSSTNNSGGSSYTPSQSTGNGGSSADSSSSGDVHYDWEDTVTTNPSCASGGFCPIG